MNLTVQVGLLLVAVCSAVSSAYEGQHGINGDAWVKFGGRRLLKSEEHPEMCNVPASPEHQLGLRPCKELEKEEKANKRKRQRKVQPQKAPTAQLLPQHVAGEQKEEMKEERKERKDQKAAAWWSEFQILAPSCLGGVAFVFAILVYDVLCGSSGLPTHEYARVGDADGFEDNGESDDVNSL